MGTGKLNFSWLVDGKIAGHSAPESDDDLHYLKSMGIKALVRMAEIEKARVTPIQLKRLGFTDCHEPVADFTPPDQSQIDRMITFIRKSVSEGRPTGVSCGAGIGRTGTILTCYLVQNGLTADQAIEQMIRKRGTDIETHDQKEAVRTYAKSVYANNKKPTPKISDI